MFDFDEFYKLLEAVTVDCKDDGECFTVADRIEVIERLLDKSLYKIISREPLALIYAKREPQCGDSVLLFSSHADCLHGNCFCRDEGDSLRGTFDNSFTNAALLWAMLNDLLPDGSVVAFTGNEETDSQGAAQVVLAIGRMQCRISLAVTLDVTNVGWCENSLFTIENDACIDMLAAHKIISSLVEYDGRYSFRHDAEPDESWLYAEYGVPSFSFCIPASGDLHGDEGVLLSKESIPVYCKALCGLGF